MSRSSETEISEGSCQRNKWHVQMTHWSSSDRILRNGLRGALLPRPAVRCNNHSTRLTQGLTIICSLGQEEKKASRFAH